MSYVQIASDVHRDCTYINLFEHTTLCNVTWFMVYVIGLQTLLFLLMSFAEEEPLFHIQEAVGQDPFL